MSMTKDQFLSFGKTAPVPVDVPEWGTTVYIKMMSGKDRCRWYSETVADEDAAAHNQASLLVKCLCDEQGTRLFSDSAEDMDAVNSKDWHALKRITTEALKLNKLTSDADEDAKKN